MKLSEPMDAILQANGHWAHAYTHSALKLQNVTEAAAILPHHRHLINWQQHRIPTRATTLVLMYIQYRDMVESIIANHIIHSNTHNLAKKQFRQSGIRTLSCLCDVMRDVKYNLKILKRAHPCDANIILLHVVGALHYLVRTTATPCPAFWV